MSLTAQITNDIKAAMKAKDDSSTSTSVIHKFLLHGDKAFIHQPGVGHDNCGILMYHQQVLHGTGDVRHLRHISLGAKLGQDLRVHVIKEWLLVK